MSDEPQMSIDEFLSGIPNLPEPEPIVKKKDTIEDGYGSISYQLKQLLKSNPDAIHKVVDCVVYTFDPETSIFYDPDTYQEMGQLDDLGPVWADE